MCKKATPREELLEVNAKGAGDSFLLRGISYASRLDALEISPRDFLLPKVFVLQNEGLSKLPTGG